MPKKHKKTRNITLAASSGSEIATKLQRGLFSTATVLAVFGCLSCDCSLSTHNNASSWQYTQRRPALSTTSHSISSGHWSTALALHCSSRLRTAYLICALEKQDMVSIDLISSDILNGSIASARDSTHAAQRRHLSLCKPRGNSMYM